MVNNIPKNEIIKTEFTHSCSIGMKQCLDYIVSLIYFYMMVHATSNGLRKLKKNEY